MEKFEEQLNNQELSPEEKLENFRNEVSSIKEGEMEKKREWEERGKMGEGYDPHFNEINPDFLSEQEMKLYEKVKEGNLGREEFMALRKEISDKLLKKEDKNKPEYQTRDYFLLYLANIVNNQIMERELNKTDNK